MLRTILILSFLISSIFSFNIENSINDNITTIDKKIKNDNNRDETVEAGNMYFSPQDLVIDVGDTVEWINVGGTHDVDGTTNNITGEPWDNPEDFYLSTISVGNGADPASMGSVTFNTPGFYNYDCGIGSHAQNGMVGTIIVISNICDDDTACNFGEEGDCQYVDIGPDGICDCNENIFDCSGECGGSDFSCITMESSDMGFYENSDCTGSYTSLTSGMCFIESENLDPSFMFDEDACIAEGGAWLDADSCYAVDFDMSSTEEECLAMDGGLWLSFSDPYGYYMNICYIITYIDEIDNEEDCENYEDSYSLDTTWGGGMMDMDMGLLYFYDNGTWAESRGEECSLDDSLSEYECTDAGAYWDNYDMECNTDDEVICNSLNGTWYSNGLHDMGAWELIDGDIVITPSDTADGPGEFYNSDLAVDGNGNWLGIDIQFQGPDMFDEYSYDLMCMQFSFTVVDFALENSEVNIPGDISIENIYPNPFNPTTSIDFSISVSNSISIDLYDINGHLVKNITEGYYGAGSYSKLIDGSDITSGAYFVRLETEGYSITQKLMLIK
tara:strand:- start:13144 stop:14814 length:1671 start_codon:yes stop_codon:yes gene_type:complete